MLFPKRFSILGNISLHLHFFQNPLHIPAFIYFYEHILQINRSGISQYEQSNEQLSSVCATSIVFGGTLCWCMLSNSEKNYTRACHTSTRPSHYTVFVFCYTDDWGQQQMVPTLLIHLRGGILIKWRKAIFLTNYISKCIRLWHYKMFMILISNSVAQEPKCMDFSSI